jgi:cell division protein FtsQ
MMHPSNRRVSKPPSSSGTLRQPDVTEGLDPSDLAAEAEIAAKARAPRKPSKWVAGARNAAGIAMVLGISWGVAWLARQYVMTSPRFAVTEIVVSGNKLRSEAMLADEAGVAKGANVFSVDLDEGRARLSRDPWIREVTLGRRLPGTILMQVTEREAAAVVALGETYLASREGEIFKRLEPGDPIDLPIITGLTADAVADDREGVARSIRRALDLAADYEHTSLGQKAQLQEIHLAPDGSTTLVVGKNGLALNLGDPPFRKKLEQASRVVSELDRRGAHADAIMLDNDARPERVVVRVR